MSIEPPNGILDIRRATLWVSKYLSPVSLRGTRLHPPPQTDITLFAPWIHFITYEMYGIHASLDIVINDKTESQGPTYVNLGNFVRCETVCENYVIKYT